VKECFGVWQTEKLPACTRRTFFFLSSKKQKEKKDCFVIEIQFLEWDKKGSWIFISVYCLFVNNNLLQVSSRESHGKDIRHVTFQQTLLEVCIHDPQFLQICASTEWKWIEMVPWQNKSYEEMLQIKLITEQSIISNHSYQPQNSV